MSRTSKKVIVVQKCKCDTFSQRNNPILIPPNFRLPIPFINPNRYDSNFDKDTNKLLVS